MARKFHIAFGPIETTWTVSETVHTRGFGYGQRAVSPAYNTPEEAQAALAYLISNPDVPRVKTEREARR